MKNCLKNCAKVRTQIPPNFTPLLRFYFTIFSTLWVLYIVQYSNVVVGSTKRKRSKFAKSQNGLANDLCFHCSWLLEHQKMTRRDPPSIQGAGVSLRLSFLFHHVLDFISLLADETYYSIWRFWIKNGPCSSLVLTFFWCEIWLEI